MPKLSAWGKACFNIRVVEPAVLVELVAQLPFLGEKALEVWDKGFFSYQKQHFFQAT